MPHHFHPLSWGLAATALCLSAASCQNQSAEVRTPAYNYSAGRSAILVNGKAIAPPNAPKRIKRIIAAGNKIVDKPYRMGGGHGKHHDTGYDCSGSIAFILKEARLLRPNMYPTSGGFLKWGYPGYGKWLTVYAKSGHVFAMVAGLRFDTTGNGPGEGPRWHTKSRRSKGFYVRHAPGI